MHILYIDNVEYRPGCNWPHIAMVSLLYDPTVYYTNEEFTINTKQEVDILAKVEVPQVLITAR